jgi:MFS family permease
MYCYRHPKIATKVSCGKCDRPICTRCMVSGPAGMRCPECASLRGSTLYKVHPGRLALTIAASIACGVIGAYILVFIGFFVFFIGPAYGTAIAEVVLRVSGRKRGRLIEAIGIGGICLGALIALGPRLLGLLAMLHLAQNVSTTVAGAGMSFAVLWPLIGVVLAISACFYRLRYL